MTPASGEKPSARRSADFALDGALPSSPQMELRARGAALAALYFNNLCFKKKDVRVSRSKKKGPMGPGRKRTKKTAWGGYYVPEAWDQVLFSDFFSPSGFTLVCPAFL